MFEKISGKVVFIGYDTIEKNVVIPETFEGEPVTEISQYCFYENRKIEEIILPKSIEIIGMGAFNFCFSLKKIELPKGLIEMHARAFAHCSKLEEITLPDTVKIAKGYAFAFCSNLKKIKLSEGLTEINNNVFEGCSSLEEVVLPASVTKIGNGAFAGCKNLKKINLNEGITEIGASAFFKCESLKEVVLPATICKIGNDIFGNCLELKKVIMLNNLQFKAEKIFFKTPKLEEVNINLLSNFDVKNQCRFVTKKLDEIDSYAPEEKGELISYVKKNTAIKKYIFSGNFPKIITLLIAEQVKFSLEDIDECVERCIKNEYLEVTAILLEYKNNNFTNEEIADYNEQNELVEIGLQLPTVKQLKDKWHVVKVDGGFKITGYKGKNTTEIIPEMTSSNVPIIGVSNGKGKTFEPIQNLTIDAKIEALQYNVFEGCKSLREINLPETVSKFRDNCFTNCINLERINSLENVKEIEGNPFLYCEKLVDKNGFFIIRNTLYKYHGNLDIVEVPEGVEVVQKLAFDVKNLKEITFNLGLIKICQSAFYNCNYLEKVTLPKATNIEGYAFYQCLKSIEIVRF